MDQETLVKAGHTIVKALQDQNDLPRAALWVHATDTDTWKLWVLPKTKTPDRRDFYRTVSSIVSKHRADLGTIDAADIELIEDTHPVIQAMRNSRAFRVTGNGIVHVKSSTFDGYYLAEAIILQMTL